MNNMHLDRRGNVELAAERFHSLFAANTFGMLCGVGARVTEANAAFLGWIRVEAVTFDGLELSDLLPAYEPGASPVSDGSSSFLILISASRTIGPHSSRLTS